MPRLLALLSLTLLAGCALPGPATTPDGIRILVYNVHAGKDAARRDNLVRVAALVRDTRADLVLLQEVDSATRRSGGVDQLDVLRRATGMYGAFGNTFTFQGGGFGTAVLSRYPIRSWRLFRLPGDSAHAPIDPDREPRGALHVEVEGPDGPLHLLNTHLDASAHDRWRLEEATRLAQIADSLSRPGARVVVGGDMNSLPQSAVQELVGSAGLRDAWSRCGRGEGFTFPAHAPSRRIDYLYLTGDLDCAEAAVPATEASDHRPLFVVLRRAR